MSNTSAKNNPMNKDDGDRNRGSEPGQEQQSVRHDRQNMGPGLGSVDHARNQGREGGRGTGRNTHSEKGDSRRR